jgi:hypothetical protein
MPKLSLALIAALFASILAGCTGPGRAGFLPVTTSAHTLHVQDDNGGIIPGGGDGSGGSGP